MKTDPPAQDDAGENPHLKREYWCFISYRHADNQEPGRQWASWLHQALETYEVPADLVGSRNERGDPIPERIFPVFRDEEELPADAELSKPIEIALRRSRFLVVLCSPQAGKSRWVADEILRFKQLGKQDLLLAAIIEGEPNASDDPSKGGAERECFPEPLRFAISEAGQLTDERTEPIAADFRLPDGSPGWTSPAAYREALKGGGLPDKQIALKASEYAKQRDLMLLKIIAGVLGIPLGVLTQRDKAYQLERQRQKTKALRWWLAAVGMLGCLALTVGGIAWMKQREAELQAVRATHAERAVIAREERIADFLIESGQNQIRTGGDPRPAMFAFYHALERLEPDSKSGRRARLLLNETAANIGKIFVHDSPLIAAGLLDKTARHIFTMAEGPRVAKWDIETRARVPLEKAPPPAPGALPRVIDGENVIAIHESAGFCVTAPIKRTVVNLRNLKSKKIIATLRHDSVMMAMIRKKDGRPEMVQGPESEVEPKLKDQELIGRITRRELHILHIGFSPDGSRLVTTTGDSPAHLWDAASGKLILKTENAAVAAFAFNPSGGYFVTGSKDKIVRFWKSDSGQLIGESESQPEEVGEVQFSPDGSKFVTRGRFASAQLWSANTRLPVGQPMGDLSFHFVNEFSADGRILYLGTKRNTIAAWNTETSALEAETAPQGGSIISLFLCPDGRTMITAGSDQTARVIRDPVSPVTSYRHGKEISAIAFGADGKIMITSSKDTYVRVFECDDKKKTAVITRKLKGSDFANVLCATVSPDGKLAACGDAFGEGRLWDLQTGGRIGKEIKHDQMIESMVFSPDNQQLLTGSMDGTARLWSAATGEPAGLVIDHGKQIISVDFSPDGKLIATGGGEIVRLWDSRTGNEIRTANPIRHVGVVTAIRFSPDGQRLLTGSSDRSARLWDAASGSPIGKPMQHDDCILNVAFDRLSNGDLLLTVGKDKTARLWDGDTCEARRNPYRHSSAVTACAFSPSQPLFVTGCEDGDLQFTSIGFPVPADDLRRLQLWIEVQTGQREGENGIIQTLSQVEWQNRVDALRAFP